MTSPLPLWRRAIHARAFTQSRRVHPKPRIGSVVHGWRVIWQLPLIGRLDARYEAECVTCGHKTERYEFGLRTRCKHDEPAAARDVGTAGVCCCECGEVGAVFEGPKCGRCWRRALVI